MIAIPLTREECRDGDRYDELADSDALLVEIMRDDGGRLFILEAAP